MGKIILASIVIPVFNQCDYTIKCIKSLVENIDVSYFDRQNADYELIVVDNASTDNTKEFLQTINGTVKIITNSENLGYLKACNLGVKKADGKYIVLLNNDTIIKPNWLENLIDFMQDNPLAGACGSKILTKDGKIQEAGGVVLNNASSLSFGIGKDADNIYCNKICEVDYCSSTSLCIRKNLWDRLGGFDEESYSPTYYEDIDLCFAIRKEGYKVYYNPKSELYHYKNINATNILRHKNAFASKWNEELKKHLPYYLKPTSQDRNILLNPLYQQNLNNKKKLLVYFGYSLFPISSGAHARILDVIQEFIKIGYTVTLVSTDLYDINNSNKSQVQKLCSNYQINSIIHSSNDYESDYKIGIDWKRVNSPELKIHFKDIYNHLKPDVVIINYAYDADVIDLNFCKNSVNIIDMLDCITVSNMIMDHTKAGIDYIKKNIKFNNPSDILKNLQKSKYHDLFNIEYFNNQNFKVKQNELDVYNQFDITLAISKKEQELVNKNNTNKNALFIPQAFEPRNTKNTYSDDPIFIIGPSSLNLQGYLFFALKVLPLILNEEPNFKLKVFGKAATSYPKVDRIELVGFVENLDDIYRNACFSISPLLAGTGQQIKIVESLSYGVPVIMLDCLKDSAPVTHNIDSLIAKDEFEFAQFCLKLYRDRKFASTLGVNAKETTKKLLNEKVKYFNNLFKIIDEKKCLKENNKNNKNIEVISLPLVSIVVPVYNKAKYLPETIQSIANQDYNNIELIIVNDGSKDNSLEVARNEIKKYPNYNMTVYTKENLGVAHTRNYGFFRAKGDYLMNFDGDDILCPQYISKCIEQLERTKSDVCFTNLELFGNETSSWIPSEYNKEIIKFENTIPAGALFRNILFAFTKGQKVALGFGEDWEFWVNMSRFNIKVTRVNELLYRYRVIDDGIMGTFIKDSYNDTLIQVMFNNADIYKLADVLKMIDYIPKMKEKSLESINKLCKLHPYEWYPYFINGVLSEANGEYEKAIEFYNLSSTLSNNNNILPLLRWGYLTKTHKISIAQEEKFN